MVNIPLTVTILKMVTLFLTFLTLILTGAFIQMFKSYDTGMSLMGMNAVWLGHQSPAFANAAIAAMVFNFLYFTYYLVFLFWRPAAIFICMIVDTSVLGFLWIFNIGAIGVFSANAESFRNCNTAGGHCHVGRAAVAFGWFTLLLILALLAFQVTWTLMYHGMDLDTWKTPFNELLMAGESGNGLASGGGGGACCGGRGKSGGRKGSVEGGMEEGKYTGDGYQHSSYRNSPSPSPAPQHQFQQYPIPPQQQQQPLYPQGTGPRVVRNDQPIYAPLPTNNIRNEGQGHTYAQA